MTLIVDGHLDLAHGVVSYHRDLEHMTPQQIRQAEAHKGPLEHGLAMVSLPELSRGGVALVFGTLFAMPRESWTHPGQINPDGYASPEDAEQMALEQLRVYEGWAARDRIRLVKSRADLEHHLELWASDRKPGLIVLMEGADPIVKPDDMRLWWDRGVRIVGTSWGPTRYAGGTGTPTGLTDIGRELIAAMRTEHVILDISHQSWEAFWDSMQVGPYRVIASHSNTFALTPTGNRHITDEIIQEIGRRDGVIGSVMFNRFLEPAWTREDRSTPVTLDHQVRAHMTHVAGLIGWDHVGIGSDIDGGLGRDESPEELETIADLVRIGDVVPPETREGVLGGNWLRFLRQALP